MMPRLLSAACLAAPLLLSACASPVAVTQLETIDQRAGYRYIVLDGKAPKPAPDAAVLVTLSGGGLRAAAFAEGVLRALSETQIKSGGGTAPLSSDIDLVSSVSGGSVTAAHFGVYGTGGFDNFETNFLYTNVEGALIGRVFANPLRLAYPRIGVLESYLDDTLFHGKTYQDMIDASATERRPLIILNAADMASGSVFSFTQDQFDLICNDLSHFKVANAVAASAAFPVAFSALTIPNHAGPQCAAQTQAAMNVTSGWEFDAEGRPEPTRVVLDRTVDAADGLNYPAGDNLHRFRNGTTQLTYLNHSRQKNFIHLLDGGIADNLGITQPFTYLMSQAQAPPILTWAQSGKINKLLFVVVNARGESKNDFGLKAKPPGAIDTLFTAVGTPIDGTSFLLLEDLHDGKLDEAYDTVKPAAIVSADFDYIADEGCRIHFHDIATSWKLDRRDIDDLMAMGSAMVLQSPAYKAFVAAASGTVPMPKRTVNDICAPYKLPPPK
jgi:NTE family protein